MESVAQESRAHCSSPLLCPGSLAIPAVRLAPVKSTVCRLFNRFRCLRSALVSAEVGDVLGPVDQRSALSLPCMRASALLQPSAAQMSLFPLVVTSLGGVCLSEQDLSNLQGQLSAFEMCHAWCAAVQASLRAPCKRPPPLQVCRGLPCCRQAGVSCNRRPQRLCRALR